MGLSGKLFKNELSHLNPAGFLKNRLSGVRITKAPVFIVGCGHSGTTLLRHLMGLHPNLYAPPYESRIFLHSPAKIRLAAAVWSFAAIAAGKTRWVEKTPAHIHCIGRIFKHYPDARVILLIRDGRDTAGSLYKRYGDFERSVRRWVDDNRAGEPFWNHPQVLKLNYETLVADFENQMKAICAFIGEPFDERLLEFSKGDSAPELPSRDGAKPSELRDTQIQSGLYNGQGRWAAEMTDDQKGRFKELAGDMLIRYGYADGSGW
jgi:hypothetical protein